MAVGGDRWERINEIQSKLPSRWADMGKVIVGTGSDLPEWTLTNDDIERMSSDYDRARSGTSLHEWSMQRAGVAVRHRVRPGEGTSDMGLRAARRALEDAGLRPQDIDLIIVATMTSDHFMPMTGSLIQSGLGCRCKFFQLEHACSGFIDAQIVGAALMDFMPCETVLVVNAEAGSMFLDPTRFMMQTVFGDGAAATVMQKMDGRPYGLLGWYSESDGSIGEWTKVPAGRTKMPITVEVLEKGLQYMQLQYHKVYPFAVEKMANSCQVVADKAGITLDDVDWFIPHQTGRNILMDIAHRLEQPEEKFFINVDHTGNTSGASIPIALDEANRAGLLHDGDLLMMPAMGGGMSWGAVCFRWYDYRNNGAAARS
jgi:3-oxoacyl-[acyl-carrier-protein] synthase-3